MDKETIKKKLELTDKQKELLDKFICVWKEMKENNIGMILDYCLDSLSLTAYNNAEVLQVGNIEDLNTSDVSNEDIVDVEDCMNWGNVDIDYKTYDSYYSNLHVIFGDKTELNKSMISASL